MSAYPEIPAERASEFKDSARRILEHVRHDGEPWRIEALMRCAYLLGRMDGMAEARDAFTAAMGDIRTSARP